jgi:hypothetical protein
MARVLTHPSTEDTTLQRTGRSSMARRSKVGVRRTAELCFLAPPSEPGMRLSPHPALRLSVSLSFLSMTVFA